MRWSCWVFPYKTHTKKPKVNFYSRIGLGEIVEPVILLKAEKKIGFKNGTAVATIVMVRWTYDGTYRSIYAS
jgi:hypothetical protein